MSYPVNASGVADIDGVVWGWRWASNQANGHTELTYCFPSSPTGYGYDGIGGFSPFTAAQREAGLKALALYDSYCNLDFVFTADTAAGNIRMAEADWIDVGYGYGEYPIGTAFGWAPDPNFSPPVCQGDTWFNHDFYENPAAGSFAFFCGILHELGHALGLKHAHQTQEVQAADGTILYVNPALPYDHDSFEYSVMTYRSYVGAELDTGAVDHPSTPMQDDIYALQWLYGPNYDHNAGNTTYSFNPKTGAMSVNGVSEGPTVNGKILLTIWDGGGSDTYDFRNYRTDATIDLNPGAWSTPSKAQLADLDAVNPGTHLARGSIANALVFQGDLHGYIENAVGGSGDDRIAGNLVSNTLSGMAGNDRLNGRDGVDALWGGSGRDTLTGGDAPDLFVFRGAGESRAGRGRDDILDFDRGEGDLVMLSTMDANSNRGGDQHFRFIGATGFHGRAGELRSAGHLLQGDTNGDGRADFEVHLNVAKLGAGDLILA